MVLFSEVRIQVIPSQYTRDPRDPRDSSVEIRVDVKGELAGKGYGYADRLPENHFESLFERVMQKATSEIKALALQTDVETEELIKRVGG